MDTQAHGRRSFLKTIGALGAVGLPGLAPGLWPSRLVPAGAALGAASRVAYDPTAKFAVTVSELEFRRNRAGRMLMARVYRPDGPGPFPTVLDLHGGAWNAKDRFAEEPMDRALAASGVLVVAIDLTLAPEAPYPASVQDANYGVRWLKSKAAPGMATRRRSASTAARAAATSPSSLSMRPRDPRYNAIPLPEAPQVDATVAYVAMRSPISDPYARFKNAEEQKRDEHDREPQDLLQAVGDDLRVQPSADPRTPGTGHARAAADHAGRARRQRAARIPEEIRRHLQGRRRRTASYHLFEGAEHQWVANEGPQTDKAREMVKAFIARHA